MKLFRSLATVTTSGILLAMVFPALSLAKDVAGDPSAIERYSPESRGQWVRGQLDREAGWLEIKASQQSAWEGYVAASIELLGTFSGHSPMPPDIDAASAIRQHATHAAAFAQSLSRLADATDKLQAVLEPDQRKVLDRIVRMHSQFHGGHFDGGDDTGPWHHHGGKSADGEKVPAKTLPGAKPKN